MIHDGVDPYHVSVGELIVEKEEKNMLAETSVVFFPIIRLKQMQKKLLEYTADSLVLAVPFIEVLQV